jgi:hypothetical protein
MNRDQNVDHILDSWFTEGPTKLPDRTVAAIADQLDVVRQRGPFGLAGRLHMPRFLPAVTSAAIVLLVAVVAIGVYFNGSGVGVAPSPTPSPSASPTSGLSRFTSTIHGITIDYPSEWQARAATEPFVFGPGPDFEAPNVDVIFDPALQDQLFFALMSWPQEGCCSAMFQATLSCSDQPGSPFFVDYAFDGADESFIRECHDEDGALRHTFAAAKAGRAYIIEFRVDDPALQGAYDAAWFEGILDGVDLLPAEAGNQ